MDKTKLKARLFEYALQLVRYKVPDVVDTYFKEDLEKLTVKQFYDDDFMDDWREQKRIILYDLANELSEEYYDSSVSTKKGENDA